MKTFISTLIVAFWVYMFANTAGALGDIKQMLAPERMVAQSLYFPLDDNSFIFSQESILKKNEFFLRND